MTDGLEIRGGGAVAVDTGTLRQTATRFALAGMELEAIAQRLSPLRHGLFAERSTAWGAVSAASALFALIRAAVDGADLLAARLREAAAVYELVELNAAHAAAFAAGDEVAMARIDAQRAAIMADHADAMESARMLELDRAVMWPAHLVRQGTEAGHGVGGLFGPQGGVIGGVALGGAVLGAAVATGVGGWGRVPQGARLTGSGPAVSLVPLVPTAAARAPSGLAEAARRVPHDTDARVRVERYAMADGSRQYAVYVSGMRSGGWGGRDPWDMRSNVELYAGERSASYQATVEALHAAGAQPGDAVHAFGHSQGAMVVAHLALEGEFDTRTLVTYGSPVDADVGSGTLSVAVRHTDDPIVALAGGGHVGAVGADGSFIVEREAHPPVTVNDVHAPGHDLVGYAQTAELVDASTDPRVDAVRAVFGDLGAALEVEVFEFAAERVEEQQPPPPVMRGRAGVSPSSVAG